MVTTATRVPYGDDNPKRSTLGMHQGEVLFRLANTYPTLLLTIIESIQNAIDVTADRIMICIDMPTRSVLVVDNGSGVTIDRFELALNSVGRGVKDKGSLGRFGLGLISPLNKCARFTFISAPAGRRRANRWTFSGRHIKAQHHMVNIPRDELPSLPKLGRKFQEYAIDEFAQEWRTMVNMSGVTKDKVTSLVDLDELEHQVRHKLGPAMRRNKVCVRVVLVDDKGKVEQRDMRPAEYSGESLGVVAYEAEDTGRVEFELYRTAKLRGKRSGEVVVMELDGNYPLTMKEFANQARGSKLASPEVLKMLESGYFEGVIRCEKIALHPERTKFEYTDALKYLYLVIDQWYDEYGRAHFQAEQEETRETRWKEIAVRGIDSLREKLAQPEYSRLWDGLMSVVEFGRLGEGHVDPASGVPDGIEDTGTVRTGQGGVGVPRVPRPQGTNCGPRGGNTTDRQPDRPGDKPIGIRGLGGQKRQLVKGDSKGLWFGFEQMPGNSNLWEFDRKLGILILNTRHPTWVKVDETDGRHLAKNARYLQHLLEWLSIEVLHLLLHYADETDFELNRSLLDGKIKHYVDMFIMADKR